MSVNHQPLVSIGIPVYNGENFIREALDSIVNQTYQNLEIIISDNASTDKTQEICESYQKQDDRIKYIRFLENKGAAFNFNTTFDSSTGKYFKWASHDDYLGTTYIERCVDYLESHPQTHLCQSRKNIVNNKNITIKRLDYPGLEINGEDGYERFKSFLKTFRYFQDDADVVFGVFRSNELAKTQKIANYHSSDFTLTAEIVLWVNFA
jgi:glycosyltransferase involved in cell wall biosynthesis